jgi:hypothetical protein
MIRGERVPVYCPTVALVCALFDVRNLKLVPIVEYSV